MIIGIAGPAGSGKDTVAGFIAKYSSAVCIAQADPMKRFAGMVFGFSHDQLWGPSESRNAPDTRYTYLEQWEVASQQLSALGRSWVADVFHDASDRVVEAGFVMLEKWFNGVRAAHTESHVAGPGCNGSHKPLTPRYVLQTIGTEWGRHCKSSMWNDYAIRVANQLLEGGHSYSNEKGLDADGDSKVDPEFVLVTDVRFKNELLGIQRNAGIVVLVRSPSENNADVEKAGVAGHKSEAELKGIPTHWYDYVITNNKARGLLALENCVHTFVNSLRTTPPMFSTEIEGQVYEAYEVAR